MLTAHFAYPMNAIIKTACRFVTSSIGRKIIVALTGACLLIFLLGHLAGNLLMYADPIAINTYAHSLHLSPLALWAVRLGLLAVFVIHILLTIQLKLENAGARDNYKFSNTITATWSSRYMVYSGLTVLAFLIYHLLQYTVRVGLDPVDFQYVFQAGTYEGINTFNVHKMIVAGFSHEYVTAIYLIAVIMLFTHLRHGVLSIFQTVGLNTRKTRPWYNLLAIGYATLVCVGFASIPVAVQLGIIK